MAELAAVVDSLTKLQTEQKDTTKSIQGLQSSITSGFDNLSKAMKGMKSSVEAEGEKKREDAKNTKRTHGLLGGILESLKKGFKADPESGKSLLGTFLGWLGKALLVIGAGLLGLAIGFIPSVFENWKTNYWEPLFGKGKGSFFAKLKLKVTTWIDDALKIIADPKSAFRAMLTKIDDFFSKGWLKIRAKLSALTLVIKDNFAKSIFGTLLDDISRFFSTGWSKITIKLAAAKAWIMTETSLGKFLTSIDDFFKSKWASLTTKLAAAKAWIGKNHSLSKMLTSIDDFFKSKWASLTKQLTAVMKWLRPRQMPFIGTLFMQINSFFSKKWTWIKDTISKIKTFRFNNLLLSIKSFFSGTVGRGGAWVFEKISSLLKTIVIKPGKGLLGILTSLSKMTLGTGQWEKIAKTLEKMKNIFPAAKAVAETEGAAAKVAKVKPVTFFTVMSKIGDFFGGLMNWLKSGGQKTLDAIKNSIFFKLGKGIGTIIGALFKPIAAVIAIFDGFAKQEQVLAAETQKLLKDVEGKIAFEMPQGFFEESKKMSKAYNDLTTEEIAVILDNEEKMKEMTGAKGFDKKQFENIKGKATTLGIMEGAKGFINWTTLCIPNLISWILGFGLRTTKKLLTGKDSELGKKLQEMDLAGMILSWLKDVIRASLGLAMPEERKEELISKTKESVEEKKAAEIRLEKAKTALSEDPENIELKNKLKEAQSAHKQSIENIEDVKGEIRRSWLTQAYAQNVANTSGLTGAMAIASWLKENILPESMKADKGFSLMEIFLGQSRGAININRGLLDKGSSGLIATKPMILGGNTIIGETKNSYLKGFSGAARGMVRDESPGSELAIPFGTADKRGEKILWDAVGQNIAGMTLQYLQMERGAMTAGGVGSVGGNIIGSEIGNTVDASQQTIINQQTPIPIPNVSFARQITGSDYRGAI